MLAVVLLAGALQIAFHNRGIWIEDEGFILEAGARVARGEVLYRDVASALWPGVFWVQAGLFKLFGEGILPGRWAMVALFAALCGFVFVYLQRADGSRVAWIGVVLVVVARILAFPTWTVPNYTHWSLFFLIANLLVLQAYPDARSPRRLLALGAIAGLGTVFKQNYGAINLAVVASSVLALEPTPWDHRRLAARLAAVGSGYGLIVGPLLMVLAAQDAVADFVRDTLPFLNPVGLRPFYTPLPPLLPRHAGAADPRTVFTYFPPFLYSAMVERPHPLLQEPGIVLGCQGLVHASYYLPPVTFAGVAMGLAYAWRRLSLRERATWAPALIAAVLLYASILYRADWIHLANALLPTLVIWALVVGVGWRALRPLPAGRVAWAFALVFGGATSVAIAGLSTWAIIRANDRFLEGPRAGIYVGEAELRTIEAVVPFLRGAAAAGEPAVFLGHQRMLPFLAGQLGRYRAEFWLMLLLRPGEAGRLGEKLAADRPRWIVYTEAFYMNSELRFTSIGRPVLDAIAPSYRFARSLGDQFVVAAPDRLDTGDRVIVYDFLESLGQADVALETLRGQATPGRDADPRAERAWWFLEPQLAVRVQDDRVILAYPPMTVPDGALLRFTVSVNPAFWPMPVSLGTHFRVAARHDSREDVIFDRVIDPWTTIDDRAPLPAEIDLSVLAGHRVRFVWTADSLARADSPLPRVGWGRPQVVRPSSLTSERPDR